MGSIKRASLVIKAHNRLQFDIIDILYLRLGYTVYIEFGNTHYINNDGELVVAGTQDSLIHDSIGGFLNQEYNESDYTEWLPLIEQKRKQTCGNYEGIFGRVSNFNWSFNEDGSYDINVEIISLGDIIESLKVNIPPLKPRVDKYQQTQNQTLLNQLQNSPATFTQFYGTLYPDLEGVLSKWLEGVNDNVSTLTVNQNTYEFDGRNSSTGIYEIDN